jgi:hypothetical protein
VFWEVALLQRIILKLNRNEFGGMNKHYYQAVIINGPSFISFLKVDWNGMGIEGCWDDIAAHRLCYCHHLGIIE